MLRRRKNIAIELLREGLATTTSIQVVVGFCSFSFDMSRSETYKLGRHRKRNTYSSDDDAFNLVHLPFY